MVPVFLRIPSQLLGAREVTDYLIKQLPYAGMRKIGVESENFPQGVAARNSMECILLKQKGDLIVLVFFYERLNGVFQFGIR